MMHLFDVDDDDEITDNLWVAIGYASVLSTLGTAVFVGLLWWAVG